VNNLIKITEHVDQAFVFQLKLMQEQVLVNQVKKLSLIKMNSVLTVEFNSEQHMMMLKL